MKRILSTISLLLTVAMLASFVAPLSVLAADTPVYGTAADFALDNSDKVNVAYAPNLSGNSADNLAKVDGIIDENDPWYNHGITTVGAAKVGTYNNEVTLVDGVLGRTETTYYYAQDDEYVYLAFYSKFNSNEGKYVTRLDYTTYISFGGNAVLGESKWAGNTFPKNYDEGVVTETTRSGMHTGMSSSEIRYGWVDDYSFVCEEMAFKKSDISDCDAVTFGFLVHGLYYNGTKIASNVSFGSAIDSTLENAMTAAGISSPGAAHSFYNTIILDDKNTTTEVLGHTMTNSFIAEETDSATTYYHTQKVAGKWDIINPTKFSVDKNATLEEDVTCQTCGTVLIPALKYGKAADFALDNSSEVNVAYAPVIPAPTGDKTAYLTKVDGLIDENDPWYNYAIYTDGIAAYKSITAIPDVITEDEIKTLLGDIETTYYYAQDENYFYIAFYSKLPKDVAEIDYTSYLSFGGDVVKVGSGTWAGKWAGTADFTACENGEAKTITRSGKYSGSYGVIKYGCTDEYNFVCEEIAFNKETGMPENQDAASFGLIIHGFDYNNGGNKTQIANNVTFGSPITASLKAKMDAAGVAHPGNSFDAFYNVIILDDKNTEAKSLAHTMTDAFLAKETDDVATFYHSKSVADGQWNIIDPLTYEATKNSDGTYTPVENVYYDETYHWTACSCGNAGEKVAHDVGNNDDDCTKAVVCSCGCETIAPRDAHEAAEDDGDVTTPVKCKYCNTIVIDGIKYGKAADFVLDNSDKLNVSYAPKLSGTSDDNLANVDGIFDKNDPWYNCGIDAPGTSMTIGGYTTTNTNKLTASEMKAMLDNADSKYYVTQDDKYIYLALSTDIPMYAKEDVDYYVSYISIVYSFGFNLNNYTDITSKTKAVYVGRNSGVITTDITADLHDFVTKAYRTSTWKGEDGVAYVLYHEIVIDKTKISNEDAMFFRTMWTTQIEGAGKDGAWNVFPYGTTLTSDLKDQMSAAGVAAYTGGVFDNLVILDNGMDDVTVEHDCDETFLASEGSFYHSIAVKNAEDQDDWKVIYPGTFVAENTADGYVFSNESYNVEATYDVTLTESDADKAATCDSAGLYFLSCTCGVIGEDTEKMFTVEVQHTPGDVVVENEVEATCKTAGSYDEVVYCTVCNTEISRDTTTVNATGVHTYYDFPENFTLSTTDSTETNGQEGWVLSDELPSQWVIRLNIAGDCSVASSYKFLCKGCGAVNLKYATANDGTGKGHVDDGTGKCKYCGTTDIEEEIVTIPARTEGAYRIVSHNIMFLSMKNDANRITWLKDAVMALDADIFAMQEVDAGWYNTLNLDTVMAELGYSRVDVNCATTIYFKTDKFEVVDKGLTAYTAVAEWGSNNSYLWAVLKDITTEEQFVIANTHFIWGANNQTAPDSVRADCAEQLVADLNAISAKYNNIPVMCTGDFNSNIDTDAYKYLAEKLTSARDGAATNKNMNFATSGNYGIAPEKNKSGAIDHVFYSGIDGLYFETVISETTYKYADHSPVCFDFVLHEHTEAEAVVENKVDATCTAAGSYDNVVYCTVCKAEVSRETVTTEKLAHTYVDVQADKYFKAEEDSVATYYKSCSVCEASSEGDTNETFDVEVAVKVGDSYFNTLEEAIAAAEENDVITLTGDYTAESIMVPAEVTLDLNGKTLKVDSFNAFGYVIDGTAGGESLLIVAIGECTLEPTNPFLPVYDTTGEESGYRFYAFELPIMNKPVNENQTKFGVRLTFTNADAYEIIKSSAETGLSVGLTIKIAGYDDFKMTYKASTLVEYAETMQRTDLGNGKPVMVVTISGLGVLEAGTTITAYTTVLSTTSVSAEGAGLGITLE